MVLIQCLSTLYMIASWPYFVSVRYFVVAPPQLMIVSCLLASHVAVSVATLVAGVTARKGREIERRY